MVQVVIVNGRPTAGKTTFEDDCITILGEDCAGRISTIDLIKKAAMVLGWNGEKNPRNRKFLSDLKFLADEWDNVSLRTIKQKVNEITRTQEIYDVEDVAKYVLFVDVREIPQIKQFKEELNAITLVVRNEKAEQMEASNIADANVLDFEYDIVVDNDGSLEDLMRTSIGVCEKILHWNDSLGE